MDRVTLEEVKRDPEVDKLIVQGNEYLGAMTRMMTCRRTAAFLNCHFGLVVNGARLL